MWRGGLRFSLLLPPLSCGGASIAKPSLRFHILLIELDMQISRIQLSDKNSHLRTRKVITVHSVPAQDRVPRRATTERSAHNHQRLHLGGHSFPGAHPEFFLRFSMRHLPQVPHINGVY